jgi:phosphoribosylglycinamide formyltransferase-1
MRSHAVAERFVSEPIEPVVETCDTTRMSMGEPGLPRQFVWRGKLVEIVAVLRTWHDIGPCRHGSEDMYVRKHWYEVATRGDAIMKIYFDRQSRRGFKGARWWLFSIDDGANPRRVGPDP